MGFEEFAKAIYLQAGFQKWCAAMARGVLLTNIKPNISHRAAFLGGAMFGQQWSGPASAKLRMGCSECQHRGARDMQTSETEGRNPAMPGFITPNRHEKDEWSRMATAAYAADRNDIGHRFSVAASLPSYGQVTVAYFDRLQREYRAWLCRNEWPEAV